MKSEFKIVNKDHKPIIETMINSAALILITAGTTFSINKDFWGLLLILVGVGLEWFKYFGRDKWW